MLYTFVLPNARRRFYNVRSRIDKLKRIVITTSRALSYTQQTTKKRSDMLRARDIINHNKCRAMCKSRTNYYWATIIHRALTNAQQWNIWRKKKGTNTILLLYWIIKRATWYKVLCPRLCLFQVFVLVDYRLVVLRPIIFFLSFFLPTTLYIRYI